MPTSDMRTTLRQAADLWADRARTKAKTPEIAKGIEVGQATDSGNVWTIEIKNTAPESAAYEFGSGLQRTKGSPAKYRIAPKNASALAFEWNPARVPYGSPKFIGISSTTGKYLFRFVEHPGVKPEPHMQPALDEVKAQMVQMIGQSFVVNVVHKSIREEWLRNANP